MVLAGCSTRDAPNPSPANVSFLHTRQGKPPLRFYTVDLEIRNRHQKPTWFVIRYSGDEPLPATNEFQSSVDAEQPFGGREYVHEGKRVVQIDHIGDDSFIAFHLPAMSSIKLFNYEIDAWDKIVEFEIWEASHLKVNGNRALEDWLPYKTLSAHNASIPKGQDWTNLDWDIERQQERSDYPSENVETISASVIQKWKVPLVVDIAP